MADIRSILAERDRYVDSMLNAFEQHLREILARAQTMVQARLQSKLAMEDGMIARTAGNMRALRTIDAMFERAMDEAGWSRLLEAFAAEFPQQLPYLSQIIDALSDQMREPLPRIILSAKDRAVLVAQQTAAVDQVGSVVSYGAVAAKQRALMAVGGIGFEDLAEILHDQAEISIGRARTVADTAINVWYRTAADQSFGTIQRDLPQMELRYEYAGPKDAKTRPFCDRLMAAKKVYTREEIDTMSNGSIPNVFVTCGGFNCRHSWLLSVRDLENSKAA